MRQRILLEAIPNSRQKINTRMTRLSNRLSDLGDTFAITLSAATNSAAATHHIRDNLSTTTFLPNESLGSILQAWFDDIRGRSLHYLSTGGVFELLMITYQVGTSPKINTILDKAVVIRQLKLGDYFATPIVVVAALSTLSAV